MNVTVVLSGIPYPEITLHDLAQHLDKLFDTDEIRTFKVRDLPNNNKRQVALDFSSGYDAMYAQNLLDGKSFQVNGMINVLRARVTRDPKLMAEVPLSKSLLSGRQICGDTSSSSADEPEPLMSKTKKIVKADKKIDAKLNLLKIKKKVIMTEEEQLLLEREKLRRELEQLSEDEDSPPKKRRYPSDLEHKSSRKQKVRRSRHSRDTCASDLNRSSCSRDLIKCSLKRKNSSSPSPTDTYSRDLKRKGRRECRDSSPYDQRDSSPCDTHSSSHSRDLRRKGPRKRRDISPYDQRSSSPRDTCSSSRKLRGSSSRDLSGSSSHDLRGSSSRDLRGSSCRDLRGSSSRDLRGSSSRDLRGSSCRDLRGSSSRDLRGSSSRDLRGSSSRDLRDSSSRDLRDKLYDRHDKSKTKFKSSELSSYVPRRGSETSVRSYRDESRSHSRSRSIERFSYKTSGIISLRGSPTRHDNRHSEIHKRIPKDRAIEYRPNISEALHSEKRISSRTSEKLTTESIIVNKGVKRDETGTELEIKMEEFKAKRDELKAKQDEAIKDILFELKDQFNDNCVKHNVADTDKSRILRKMFEIVDRRMKNCRLTSAMTVSDLVMHYRCKYSKIEDKDLVTELFSELIATRDKTLESASTSAVNDTMWDALDSVLDKFELPALTEDVKPELEVETDNKAITNITINLNPISTNEKAKQFQVKDGNYYINITIHPDRPKKFYITIKVLIKNMKVYMRKYESYVEYELFEYIIRGILEKQIAKLVEGKPYMPAKELYKLYRESYPQEGDEDFVLQTLYDIWEGLYNDPVDNKDGTKKPSEINLGIVKQEKDNSEAEKPTSVENVSVKNEPVSENTSESGIKTENVIEKEIGISNNITNVKDEQVRNESKS